MSISVDYTPAVDTTNLYSIHYEYIIEKQWFNNYNNIQLQSEKVKGIEHAELTLKMTKKPGYSAWTVLMEIQTEIPLKYEVSFEICSENNSAFKHFRDVVDGSKIIDSNPFVSLTDLNSEKLKFSVKALFCYKNKEDERIYGKTKMIQSNDWSRRLQNHGEKDFKFIVGNESVEIHKFFLSLESTVFATMLEEKKYKETQAGQTEITDFKFETVKAFVAFCYGEDISDYIKFAQNAIELLMFADKYDMKNLKKTFEEYYSKKLTIGNVGNILTAAEKYNAAILKAECIRFIQSLPRIEKDSIVYGILDEEIRGFFFEDN
uniref:BTB domain-containing protein n=1 Tax=Panagrolaimus sp. ES5 TaxID=591445 RepID=A0AC34FM21_9BILA